MLKIVFLLSSRLPDFSEVLCEEAVYHRISIMGQTPPFHRTHFFVFLMQFGFLRSAPFVSSPIHLFNGLIRDKAVLVEQC